MYVFMYLYIFYIRYIIKKIFYLLQILRYFIYLSSINLFIFYQFNFNNFLILFLEYITIAKTKKEFKLKN